MCICTYHIVSYLKQQQNVKVYRLARLNHPLQIKTNALMSRPPTPQTSFLCDQYLIGFIVFLFFNISSTAHMSLRSHNITQTDIDAVQYKVHSVLRRRENHRIVSFLTLIFIKYKHTFINIVINFDSI